MIHLQNRTPMLKKKKMYLIVLLKKKKKFYTLFDFINTVPLINHSTVGNGVDVNVTLTFKSSPLINRYSFVISFIFGGSSLTAIRSIINYRFCVNKYK